MIQEAFLSFKLALVQLSVSANKEENLENAHQLVVEAARNGANVVVLPECFNSPYGTKFFPEYAECMSDGPSLRALSDMAKEAQVYLIGGSIPEREESTGKLYNTCTVYDRQGIMIAMHRKIHLYDVDIPGKIQFQVRYRECTFDRIGMDSCFCLRQKHYQENEILSPGNSLTHVNTEYGKIGIGICYDVRFPELATIAARKGCIAMIYPGAFPLVTGPLYWELLQRSSS
ncbi:omega-amidase NIT2-like protein [Endogone sp. FLAS-F59071]|nr:omega-amidase NIT2-like protein [Endogone sp. FLAS-F59071]|eukprot:RUS22151.1 omega-amidase NIT2-like protein [Endogone sp. FLAS-F59071]